MVLVLIRKFKNYLFESAVFEFRIFKIKVKKKGVI